jgi:hypothetical protein
MELNKSRVPMQFSYVDIKTKGCEGWLNLFFGDYCIALVDNIVIAKEIRKSILPRPRKLTKQEFCT